MLNLVLRSGGGVRHPLKVGTVSVGTAADNDVVLRSNYVSRRHALLHVSEDGVEIEDLGSRNGTIVEGRKVQRLRLSVPARIEFALDAHADVLAEDSEDVLLFPGTGEPHRDAPCRPREEPSLDAPLPVRSGLASAVLEAMASSDEAGRPAAVRARVERHFVARGCVIARLQSGAEPEWLAASPTLTGRWDEIAAVIDLGDRGVGDIGAWSVQAAGLAAWIEGGTAPSADERAVLASILALLAPRPSAGPAIVQPPPPGFRLACGDRVLAACTSPALAAVHARMAGAVGSDLPVLLLGPTGVGKEVHARSLHALGPRAARPFHAINCSAIPDSLLEALLFGAEEGVATGVKRRRGLIRDADGGTVFLDEIGEMSPAMQAKLLRMLDERAVLPLGASAPVSVNVRFIAATNRVPREEIAAGRMREDLYQRLRGHEFRLPSLAERAEDVPAHAVAFLADEARRARKPSPGVTLKAMRCLATHDWPGNVRELESLMRRLVHEVPAGRPVGVADLPPELVSGMPPRGSTLDERLDVHARRIILEAVHASRGNKSEAARRLGIGRVRLRALLEKHGIEEPASDDDDRSAE